MDHHQRPRPPRTDAEKNLAPTSQTEGGPDLEDVEDLPEASRLPKTGAQIHFEYTVYADYRLLRRLIGYAGKIRLFTDEDGALIAGFKTAFADRIRDDEVQGATIKINKSLTVDERRAEVADTKTLINEHREALGDPELSDREVMTDHLAKLIEKDHNMTEQERQLKGVHTRNGWFRYPFATMAEPAKAIKNIHPGRPTVSSTLPA